MHVFTHPCFLLHHREDHPENKYRLIAIRDTLGQLGNSITWREPSPANEEQLSLIHNHGHIRKVKAACSNSPAYLDPDTYVNHHSYEAALLAAGAAIAAVDSVLTYETTVALALVRPPGHHATPTRAMGFCLFNNVAIAAAYAIQSYGLKRVMILDWDVHHGNGTQAAFYADPRVLFVSLHQFPLYPGTGFVDEIGEGGGMGTTVNIPLPPGVGDLGYGLAFDRIVMPMARRFRPELLLISAGYDAHWTDPLANMMVTVPGFWMMGAKAMEIAQEICAGRIVLVLEGGYSLQVLGAAVSATVLGIMGKPSPADPAGQPAGRTRDDDAEPIIEDVRIIHSLERT